MYCSGGWGLNCYLQGGAEVAGHTGRIVVAIEVCSGVENDRGAGGGYLSSNLRPSKLFRGVLTIESAGGGGSKGVQAPFFHATVTRTSENVCARRPSVSQASPRAGIHATARASSKNKKSRPRQRWVHADVFYDSGPSDTF